MPDLAEAIPKPTDGGKTWTSSSARASSSRTAGPDAEGRRLHVPAHLQGHTPDGRRLLQRHRRRRQVPEDARHLHSRRAAWSPTKADTVTINLGGAGRRVPRQARRAARVRPARRVRPPKDMGTKPPPGTGAYMFTTYDPNKQLKARAQSVLQGVVGGRPARRLPRRDHRTLRPDRSRPQITQIENGQADWTLDSPPADRLAEIGTKYASQVHINTLTANWYAPMNVNIPPFNNKLARQAVNFAIDRNAAVAHLRRPEAGDPEPARSCPPASPATSTTARTPRTRARKWSAPDLAKAKELVKESGTAGAEGGDRSSRTTRSTRRSATTSRAC